MRIGLVAAGLLLTILPSPAVANTLPPPPPDPATLEAARQLVEQLPLGDPERDTFPFQSIGKANVRSAVAWVKASKPKLLEDPELERLFAAEVELDSRRTFPACMPEAKEALAVWYARRLRADDARQIAAFLGTGPGQALARSVDAGPFLATLSDCAYRSIFPRLEGILASAAESNEVRRRVNSRRSDSARE
jgi:hypothetical protein